MIGIFDSGLGGMSIYERLHRAYPQLDVLYLGDHRNLPYGQRSDEDLYRLTLMGANFLFRSGCSVVILACNTASVSALDRLQAQWLPDVWAGKTLVGVAEPTVRRVRELAIECSARSTTRRVIVIFATPSTINSGFFRRNLNHEGLDVIEVACPSLASTIESGSGVAAIRDNIAVAMEEMRRQLRGRSPSLVVLGCTHYALVERQFRAFLPDAVIVSQSEFMLHEVDAIVSAVKFTAKARYGREHRLFTTGNGVRVSEVATALVRKRRVFEVTTSLDPTFRVTEEKTMDSFETVI